MKTKLEKVENYYHTSYSKAKERGGFYKFYQKLIHPKLYFAAEALEKKLENNWAGLEKLPVAVQVYEEGAFVYANRSCKRLFGIEKDSCIIDFSFLLKQEGKTHEQQLNFEKLKDEGIKTARSGRGDFLIEVRKLDCWQKSCHLVLIFEITQLKEKIQRLQEDLKNLEQEAVFEDIAIGVIGHDLKNLFNGILGMSQMMAEEIDELRSDTIKIFAESIYKQVEEANEVLSDVLLWYKIKKGQAQNEDAPLRTIVQQQIDLHKHSQKKIHFDNAVPEEIILHSDSAIVGTIVRNLLSNAVKFTNHEGKIRVEAEKNDGHVKIRVIDNGVGMTKERLAQIFGNETSSVSTLGTFKERGHGLGLNLVKKIVAALHGSISAESEVLKGTTVTVTLPV
ncbi:MAG: HAMP domain-containing sensor histidine kinase [Candidatus Anstonellaceae archaeon]